MNALSALVASAAVMAALFGGYQHGYKSGYEKANDEMALVAAQHRDYVLNHPEANCIDDEESARAAESEQE